MPVFGYLAIPMKGSIDTLRAELSLIPYCDVIPAENRDVLVLVTETPDESTERALRDTLKSIDSLQTLSMTFGHNDEQQLANR